MPTRHAPLLVIGLVLAPVLSGCFGPDESTSNGEGDGTPGDETVAPDAVIAFIDSGLNVYHRTFQDGSPRSWQHPSTYLAGYPADALPLNVSLDIEDYWEAVRTDCASVWAHVVPGQLYYVPGTKIVGGVYLAGEAGAMCDAAEPIVNGILDRGGHGTMVASRAASIEYGACRECLIVTVQGFSPTEIPLATVGGRGPGPVEWAAGQASWIDAQSNSWGPVLPIWTPAATGVSSEPEFVRTVEAAAQEHLSFWSSGNGALTRFDWVGHPTLLDPRMTPSVVMVGGHDSGYVNAWPGFPPHVVSDSCDSWEAVPFSTSDSRTDGGGTSASTPFAAGGAVRMLREARTLLGDEETGVRDGAVAIGTAPGNITSGPLADGQLTLAEWKELLFKTASARPKAQYEDGPVCDELGPRRAMPVKWEDVPEGYPEFVHIGYGAVDSESHERAASVLRGQIPMPDRSTTDAFFIADDAARSALHAVYSTG